MELFKRFKRVIDNAQRIIITTHLFPDADGIGSQISLAMSLRLLGKDVICCNEEDLLGRYNYLDPDNLVYGLTTMPDDFKSNIDLILVVDTNTIFRTGKNFLKFSDKLECPIFYIDHHPCSESIKKENCIDTSAAATGQVVGELIEKLGIEFTKKIALPLYTAILIDTSSFRYPTVSASTHLLISKLMQTGVDSPSAYNGIYGTKKISHLHALGNILACAESTPDEHVAWITLKKEELKKWNIDIEDTHAFINNLLILDNIKVACMFRDDGPKLKLSLRSTGQIDVGVIAMGLGGGGHSHSAATVLDVPSTTSTKAVIDDAVSKIEILLESQLLNKK
ncbi:MAG: DHH family phosphoesterase [Bacteriovoracaceae bacterium]|jgi:phosphoesterase RecJ-like protein|nr:DHH family phosphoesterase [Bacteriovoracaceae bacterium]